MSGDSAGGGAAGAVLRCVGDPMGLRLSGPIPASVNLGRAAVRYRARGRRRMDSDTDIGGPGRRFPATRHSAWCWPRGAPTRRCAAGVRARWSRPTGSRSTSTSGSRWRRARRGRRGPHPGVLRPRAREGLLRRATTRRARASARSCAPASTASSPTSARRRARLKRGGGARDCSRSTSTSAEGELARAALPAAATIEEYFHREWVRSLFGLAVEALRERCAGSGQATSHFALFERYDLDGPTRAERPTYAAARPRSSACPSTQVTNHLAWPRAASSARLVLETLRELTASDEEFRAEARALLGVEPAVTRLSDATLAHLREVADSPDLAGTRYELRRASSAAAAWAPSTAPATASSSATSRSRSCAAGAAAGGRRAAAARGARSSRASSTPASSPSTTSGALPDGRVFYAMKLVRGSGSTSSARDGRPLPSACASSSASARRSPSPTPTA